jgi:transaldolase
MGTIHELGELGVSVWLDDLSRERLETGNLATYVAEHGITGVTTNPTIFAGALSSGSRYDAQIRELAGQGASVDEAVVRLTTDDVRAACDILTDVYVASGGVDGRVSIEVDPRFAFDTARTLEQAHELWKVVDRPNLLIKIPATAQSLPAVRGAIGSGISVNVTLIFGLDQYAAVIDAYLGGLEDAAAAGIDLASIHSVASFFVSRVDSEIDARLNEIGSASALALRGRAGVANARLAYEVYEREFGSERFLALSEVGARQQRPLWASTGVKNPSYSPTLYVTELVAPGTVNTMPEATIAAVLSAGQSVSNRVTGFYADAARVMNDLQEQGIEYSDVIARLEREGVEKFLASWEDLLATVAEKLAAQG